MAVTINGTTGITDVDGSAAAPAITGTDTDTGLFFSANTLGMSTGGTQRAVIDSSGNLGLGVTPSGSSTKQFEIGYAGQGLSSRSGIMNYVLNGTYNSGWKYAGTGAVSNFELYNGTFAWYTAPSGTAGNAITFTQAMMLDASGGLQLGVTASDAKLYVTNGASPSSRLIVGGGGGAANTLYTILSGGNNIQFETNGSERARIDSSGTVILKQPTGTTTGPGIITDDYNLSGIRLYGASNGNMTIFANSNSSLYGNIIFQTNNGSLAERARIDSSGRMQIGHSSFPTATCYLSVQGGTYAFAIDSSAGSATWYQGTSSNVWNLYSGSGTQEMYVNTSGNAYNRGGTWGTISDENLKQDIVDAGSQWDDVKAIRFRKYRLKADVAQNPDAPLLFGVVAQEVEQTSPGLVDEFVDVDGVTRKSVKTSVMLMKSVKALQEAIAKIEQLEARIAALESK